jgi:hypothetical protein
MRKIGAYALIGAFAAAIAPASPSLAFGLRIGPLHIGLPFPHIGLPSPPHRYGRDRHVALRHPDTGVADARESAGAAAPHGSGQATAAVALYSGVALPGIFDQVFSPSAAPAWPFGYDELFRTAFATAPDEAGTRACQQPANTEAIVGRITAEIRPTPAQTPLVQNLARAIGTTAGYLARTCPQNIPAQPVARLELLQSQLQTLTMALDIVRPPLQQLEQSLSPAQKARFAAVPSDATGAAACGATPAATDWSVDDIDQSVQPDQSQRLALADLKQAFASTAVDLHAHCPQPLPATPLARLEAIEAQLDASWRAALSMQVALATFESTLNDEQRGRFDTMTVAQTQ